MESGPNLGFQSGLGSLAAEAGRWKSKMSKSISSGLTFFYKIIFPTVWISGFGIGTLLLFFSNNPEKWIFLIALIAGGFFILALCFGLKAVSMEGESLIISNYLKSIAVPFTNIENVYENKWINICPVTIYFKSRTEFGKNITFMPTAKFLLFSTHPIVKELRGKIEG